MLKGVQVIVRLDLHSARPVVADEEQQVGDGPGLGSALHLRVPIEIRKLEVPAHELCKLLA